MDLVEAQKIKSTTFLRHPWELSRLAIIESMIKTITNDCENHAEINIIDIGSGDLFVLSELNKIHKFKSLTGIDIGYDNKTLSALNVKNSFSNLRVANNYEGLELNQNEQYLILLMDVLEHVEDDKKFIDDLKKQFFKLDNVTIIVTVPSFQSLFCSHDKVLFHYRRYTNRQLSQRFSQTGLKICDNGYFFLTPMIFRIVRVLYEKTFKKYKTDSALSSWNYNRFLTKIITKVLLLEYLSISTLKSIGIKLPGLSNYIVCQKSAS